MLCNNALLQAAGILADGERETGDAHMGDAHDAHQAGAGEDENEAGRKRERDVTEDAGEAGDAEAKKPKVVEEVKVDMGEMTYKDK